VLNESGGGAGGEGSGDGAGEKGASGVLGVTPHTNFWPRSKQCRNAVCVAEATRLRCFADRAADMADDKRLFSPHSVTDLVAGWLLHAHKARDRHDLASRPYAKGQYALGIPALIASTVVGTSLFASLSSSRVLKK
jgi:hypothetical protein